MSVAVQVHVALQLCPLELPVHREDKEYTEVIRRRGHGCVARQRWEVSGRRGGTLRGARQGGPPSSLATRMSLGWSRPRPGRPPQRGGGSDPLAQAGLAL